MALRRKAGLERKLSVGRMAAAAGAAPGALVPDRGSRRFRQAFRQRLNFARSSGALPQRDFSRQTGRREFQPGLASMPQTNPMGSYEIGGAKILFDD